ncbi:MAG: amidase family protein [Chloroflexota bacterium]|nr:amidase family protein [Chloroflexota bacterium]
MSDLTSLSITEAGKLLLQRAVSSLELTNATLARIEETEPLIHAYTRVFTDEGRKAARQADRELATGHCRGPLHGIPIGVKDLFYTRDAPTEAGSRALEGFVPAYDATIVRRLRDGGAVMIGKTVTHELAYGVNAPPTGNAWNVDCYPGGSSAGSGAAVAARSAFGALGTDTGGSIREPASLNGLVGLKPTFGLVSRHGIFPLSSSLDHAGPLTRTVEDCALLLQSIAGFDPFDPGSADQPVPDFRAELEDGAAGITIGVERRYFFGDHLHSEVRDAVDRSITEFQGLGVNVVEVELPEIQLMSNAGLTILLADAAATYRKLLRARGFDLDAATRLMLELGALLPATQLVTAQRARRVLCEVMHNTFRGYGLDALLTPTLPTTTVAMDQVLTGMETGEDPLSTAITYSFPANVTGQPAITVPCGFSAAGLPIGFQLMGRPFDEPTLFRLARAYERNHSWSQMRPEL